MSTLTDAYRFDKPSSRTKAPTNSHVPSTLQANVRSVGTRKAPMRNRIN